MSVFSDFCRVSACMVALQTREDEYLEVAQRYTREELTELGRAFGMLVEEMQDKPFLDLSLIHI